VPALGAYERILFVRDPLRRLVGFYWNWVVTDSTEWCFLDDAAERSLQGATFREFVEALDAARREGIALQHHLISQVARLPADRPPDHLALVERLDHELAALDARFGLTGHDPQPHGRQIDATLAEPVMDRRPDWFDPARAPAFELFYDAELATTARRCFAEDVALHASIPGARPLRAADRDVARPLTRHTTSDEIFVSIASYRDPFLPFTIRSALEGARHPERLRFGICWQADDGESLDPYTHDPRFRILRLPYWQSRGYGWSRAEVQKLYRGEKYHLLIDSHSYLAPGWDENLIAQLERKPSTRPLLTTSAPPFTFDAQGTVVLPWAGTARDGVPLIRCSQDPASGFLDFQMSHERSPAPDTPTVFLVCNFVFTHGRWIVDVPEDPDMINASHESALAVRTYTHGYDMFLPDENQVWHLDYRNYGEGGRHKVWETKSRSWQTDATRRLKERLDALLYDRGDPAILGRHGRGTARTVGDWAARARVDLRAGRVATPPPGATLAELCERHRTDKSRLLHNYVELYELLFAPWKNEPIRFLEIGVATGSSLRVWEGYFPAAQIFGVDVVDKSRYDSPRVRTLIADQAERADLARVIASTGGEFDVVLDDGGHCMHQQQISLGSLFPALKSGGLYIIEDVHTSFPEMHPGFGVHADGRNSTYVLIERFLRTGELCSAYLSAAENEYLRANIAHCFHSVRRNRMPSHFFACWKK
jgi:hypothetical protein